MPTMYPVAVIVKRLPESFERVSDEVDTDPLDVLGHPGAWALPPTSTCWCSWRGQSRHADAGLVREGAALG